MKLSDICENVSFDTSTTQMATYDDMMKDPEYFKDKKHRVFTIMNMSPDEYIQQSYQAFKEHGALKAWQDITDLYKSRSQKLVDKYADKMKRGEKFPLVVLDFTSRRSWEGGKEKSFSQEGLHRAMAAKKAGATQMPVMVVDDA